MGKTSVREGGRPMWYLRSADHRSGFAIFGHPIHPMLIPFPIAFLSAAVVTDILMIARDSAFWMAASYWLLLAGWTTGFLAALAGLIEWLSVPKVRKLPSGYGHIAAVFPALVLALLNWLFRDPVERTANPAFLIAISCITFVLLLVGGWLGGRLAYVHRIGVTPASEEPVPTDPYAEDRTEKEHARMEYGQRSVARAGQLDPDTHPIDPT